MVDERVRARVNLFGVLKALELLPEYDAVSREITDSVDLCVEFRVPTVDRGRLHIHNSRIRLEGPAGLGGSFTLPKPHVVLACVSPRHFNAVIDGEKQPIPLKGIRRLGRLRNTFNPLTERLTYYLRPPNDAIAHSSYHAASTRLTACVALHALSEIANHDRASVELARRVPDGTIQFKVHSDIGLYVEVKDGRLRTVFGEHEDPRCILWFSDLETLDGLLRGTLQIYQAIGSGRMGMKGFVPMVESMNPLLDRIPLNLGE